MTALTIILRLLHILTGVLWVGGAAVLAWFVMPAVFMSGPTGGAFMQTVAERTKLLKYLPSMGGLAVLSGFLLFWRDVTVGGASFTQSRMGMTLSIGGLAALIGLVVGSAVATRAARELSALAAVVNRAGGAPTPEQAQKMTHLRSRLRTGSVTSLWLVLIATAAMAIARYV